MAPSAILTIEPIALGGVPALARAADRVLRRSGHTPTLIYTDAESVPTAGPLALLGYFARHPLPRREQRNGLDGLAVPLWPLPQWLGYYTPYYAARGVIRQAEVRLCVAGSAQIGLPLALDGRPFVAWIASLYEAEIGARAAVGDEWARRLLAGPRWATLQAQEKRVLEAATVVLALSPHTSAAIAQHYPTVAPRTRTLLSPIDTDAFRPNANSQDPNPKSQPYLLLTARIRDPRKNVNMLLRAFARVRAARPDLRLVVAGDEPLAGTHALAAELGLDEAVEFRGLVSQAELIRLYQSAALYVQPSRQEGLGISALEALACGLPVVSTRCGGPEGVVQEGVTGWLTPSDDEAAFAEAVLRALAAPEQLREMRAACRAYAERELARPVVEGKLLAALRDVFPQQFAAEAQA